MENAKKLRKNSTVNWKREIKTWSGTELTGAEYCRQNDLIYSTFLYHRSKTGCQQTPKLVPIETNFSIKPEAKKPTQKPIELKIGKVKIELHPGFNEKALTQVLSVVVKVV